MSSKKARNRFQKTGAILLLILIVSLASTSSLLPKKASQQVNNIVLANAEDATTLYLPLTVNGYHDPYVLYSPFSVGIAALDEIDPTTSKTLAEQQAWYDAAFPALLDALKESGATNTRVEINWSQIEPNPPAPDGTPTYSWDWYDSRFKTIANGGIQMLGSIMTSNGWAADPACSVLYPDRVDEFTRFLVDLVNHYKNPPYNIKFWEIINEPDYTWPDGATKGLGCLGYHGAEYADLLQIAYSTIKSTDPRATVIQGGVAYDSFIEYGGAFNRYFLDDVMAAGGGDFFDALNFHYFQDFHAEWERWDPNSPVRTSGALPAPTCGIVDDNQGTAYYAGGIDVIAKSSHIYNRMKTCFGVDKPIWLTETASPSNQDPLTQQEQARYVPKVYARALSFGIPSITWFALTTPNHPDGQGLLDDDFKPKPAYDAYQTMTSELMGFRYARTLYTSQYRGLLLRQAFCGS